MLKWMSLAIVLLGFGLYFGGALNFSDSGDSIDISIDKDKAEELGESLRDKLEE